MGILIDSEKAIVGLPPNFLKTLLALVSSMRHSLMNAAHADVGGAPRQEIRVAHRFRPMYAAANGGHPSVPYAPAMTHAPAGVHSTHYPSPIVLFLRPHDGAGSSPAGCSGRCSRLDSVRDNPDARA